MQFKKNCLIGTALSAFFIPVVSSMTRMVNSQSAPLTIPIRQSAIAAAMTALVLGTTAPSPTMAVESSLFPAPSRILSRLLEDDFQSFDPMFVDPFSTGLDASIRRMNVGLLDNDKSYCFTADLPGIKKSDVTIEIKDDKVLTVSAERKESRQSARKGDGRGSTQEYTRTYQRSIVLPDDAEVNPDKILAELADGVLTIDIPKTTKSPTSSKIVKIK
jgi:HSP20 family molecular chaperone IbpA